MVERRVYRSDLAALSGLRRPRRRLGLGLVSLLARPLLTRLATLLTRPLLRLRLAGLLALPLFALAVVRLHYEFLLPDEFELGYLKSRSPECIDYMAASAVSNGRWQDFTGYRRSATGWFRSRKASLAFASRIRHDGVTFGGNCLTAI